MKWNAPNPLLRAMQAHVDLPRKYRLQKRHHRYALLQNTKGLEALIAHDYGAAWRLIDALLADVLARAADLSESTPNRIRLGMYIGGQEIKDMDLETVGLEALWTLPLRMDATTFQKRPLLKSFTRQLGLWFRGFHLDKLKDIEYGPLLCAAWMTPVQRQEFMKLLLTKEDKKVQEIRDPQKIMGAQYLLGCEPASWDDHDYLAASHGIQRWLERLFFQVSPHQCFWILRPNALLGEWFADYWQAARGHQDHEDVRKNTLAGLNAMTFSVGHWYSWWSWHALVASPTARNKSTWSASVPASMGTNGIYRMGRQPLSRPHIGPRIDEDIVEAMQTKHPEMALAYRNWSGLAACTLEPEAGDVKWVHRMWDMYQASLRAPSEALPIDGLI